MSEKYRLTAFYNGVSSFKSAFPDVSDVVVEWREKFGPEDERPGELRKTGYRRGNFTQGVVPCSNPSCHEGGYQLDRLVADMLVVGDLAREGMMLCSGRETGEEVRRGPVRCPHRIFFKASLSLKGEEAPPEPKPGNRRRGRSRGPRRRDVA